jgi:hypothetical protein
MDANSVASAPPKLDKVKRRRYIAPAARVRSKRASARRFNTLVKQLTAEIGRPLSNIEAGLIRQCASLLLRCEQLQGAVVRGEVSANAGDELIRTSSEVRRIISSLHRAAKSPAAASQAVLGPLRSRFARELVKEPAP